MKNIKPSIYNELDNAKTNILKASEEFNISLPELCKLADISYKSLWRFMNNMNIPNYEILDKIANFLNISVSELLTSFDKKIKIDSYNVPIIQLSDLNIFFEENQIKEYTSVSINEFISHDSFAIKINEAEKESIYIFKPQGKLIKGILIFKFNHQILIGKIFEINDKSIHFYSLENLNKQAQIAYIDDIKVIAMAVKIIVQNNLLRSMNNDSE